MKKKTLIAVVAILLTALLFTVVAVVQAKKQASPQSEVDKYCKPGFKGLSRSDIREIKKYYKPIINRYYEGNEKKFYKSPPNCKINGNVLFTPDGYYQGMIFYNGKTKQVEDSWDAIYGPYIKDVLWDGGGTGYVLYAIGGARYGHGYNTNYLINMKSGKRIYSTSSFEDAESGGCGPDGKPRDLRPWASIIEEARIMDLKVKDLNGDGLKDIYTEIEEIDCKTGKSKKYTENLIAEKEGFRLLKEEK